MKQQPKIAIIDYGVSNLFSIHNACKRYSNRVIITEDPTELMTADAIILPGVGSFQSGMEGLRMRNLIEPVREYAKQQRPILGVCLGAQLMLDTGYEFGEHEGLGIFPGRVVRFPTLYDAKIPQIGWNTIAIPGASAPALPFRHVKKDTHFYFVHSYIIKPSRAAHVHARTSYGGHIYCSVIRSENIIGCQFHPEKSGEAGLKIIEGFVRLAGKS